MAHGASAARSFARGRSLRADEWLDTAARVVVLHTVADLEASRIVADDLTSVGYDPVPIVLDRTAVARIADTDPDLVLLARTDDSFDLPRLCAELHDALQCRTVVVDFSTRSTREMSPADEATLVETLEAGADDYVSGHEPKPLFHARIRVALRGRPVRWRPPERIEIGDVVIDLAAHTLSIGGAHVACPPLQFSVLTALALHRDAMVSRAALIASAWGVAPDSIDLHRVRIAISVLRRILGGGPNRPVIESVARLGYRLSSPSPAAAG